MKSIYLLLLLPAVLSSGQTPSPSSQKFPTHTKVIHSKDPAPPTDKSFIINSPNTNTEIRDISTTAPKTPVKKSKFRDNLANARDKITGKVKNTDASESMGKEDMRSGKNHSGPSRVSDTGEEGGGGGSHHSKSVHDNEDSGEMSGKRRTAELKRVLRDQDADLSGVRRGSLLMV